MIEDVKVGETYWYVHTAILTEYPKQVTVEDISKNIIIFDSYVGSEKFGDLNEIKKGLFCTRDESLEFFMNLLYDGNIHFIDKNTSYFNELKTYCMINLPEIFL